MKQEDRYTITFTSWNKVAQRYQETFMDLDLYNDSYDRFCERIKERGSILEIGCGPGNITRYLLNKRPDLRVLATDVAPEMIRLAKENNPAAECSVMIAGRSLPSGVRLMASSAASAYLIFRKKIQPG